MTTVGAQSTPIATQATTQSLPIVDAGVPTPDTPPPPKLACGDGTTAIAAPYPEPSWFCTRGDGVRHGAFITLYPDQQIEIAGSYKDGALAGAWERRSPSGAIAETGSYVAGQRDGMWRQLGPGGELLGQYTMKLGTGTEKRWLADGTLYSETAMKHGVPHGPLRIYDRGGVVVEAATWRAGVIDGRRVVGGKSTLRIEETYVRGTRRGARKIWQFGSLIADELYDAKGKLDGAFTLWRDRKTPRVVGTYAHGKRVGTWTWTDRNNRKEREGSYAADQKTGTWTEWLDGKLVSRGTFDAGKPDGDFIYYDRTGAELGRSRIARGTGTMLTFHPNKKVATRTQLVNGLMEGVYEELTPRGTLVVQGRYLRDDKHGTWREQTEAGVPVLEQQWKRGKLDGTWKKYEAGKLAVTATYKDGLADGPYIEYRDGKQALVGQFAADRRTGTWTAYDAEGSVTLVATYKDGVLDGPWHQRVGGSVIDGEMAAGRRAGTWTQTDRAGQTRSVTYGAP